MPDADRRVVLLPPGTSEEAASKLAAALRAAVDLQRRLAEKSQYILQLTGEVRRTDIGFVIPHEPADPLTISGLYSKAEPGAPEGQLLQIAAALTDALRAAHAGEGGRARVHGGLCPGVLVSDENAQIKITDFGFAHAICSTLGEESYVNLAIGPATNRKSEPGISGIWEVLPEHEFERDDRLCVFIDPDKYAKETLRAFESASDVIAAGFVLHLLAEHSHPYFHTDPEAHRIIDNARAMAGGLPTIARRKDLKDSANPGVKLWCQLVEQMLEPEPRDRPTASDLAKQLEPYAPKVDFDRIRALRWVAGLEATLATKNWELLARQFEEKPAIADWPADAATRLKPIENKLAELREEQKRKAAIEADRGAAQNWFNQFEGCVTAQQWEAAETAWSRRPNLAHFPEDLLKSAEPLLQQARQARAAQDRRKKIAADEALVLKWYKSVEQLVGAGDWRAAETLIHSRPSVEHWPASVSEDAVAEHEQRVREQLSRIAAEEQAREADLRAAREWLAKVRGMFERGELDAAQDLLRVRPALSFWPQSVQDEATELDDSIRSRLADEADREIRARDERARRLGQNFVVRTLAAQLAKFVDTGMVQTRVSSIEFTPGDAAGDGRAQLAVGLATAADAERGAGLRSGFVFRLTPEPGAVRDEDGALRDWLVRGLTERLVALQKTKLDEIAATLHGELFPKAEIVCELSGLSERAKATAHLLGKGQAAGDVETELRWDPKALHWVHGDAAVFAQKALGLVTAVTKKLASTKLVDQSESLKPYKPLIAVEVALANKPEPGVIPRSVQMEGRLSLKVGGNGESTVLQTIGLKCAKVGSLSLDGDLKPAEAALRDLIVAAQIKSRQSLSDGLEQRFKAAGARVKTTALPKRIADPVSEVAFELKPRAGGPVTLTAAWNAGTFAYDAPPAWETKLTEMMTAASAGGSASGTGGNRKGMLLGGVAVAAVVVIGAVIFFVTRGGGGPTDNGNQNNNNQGVVANDNGNGNHGNANGSAIANENENGAANDNAAANENAAQNANDNVPENDNGVVPENENAPANQNANANDNDAGNDNAPAPIDLVAGALTATVGEMEIAASFSHRVSVPDGAASPAYQARFFWDADGNGRFDAGSDTPIEQPVEITKTADGAVAKVSIPLAAERPEDLQATLLGVLTSTLDGEDAGNNFASVTVNIPKRVAAPSTQNLIAGKLVVDVSAAAIVAQFEYEATQSRGANVPAYTLRIFWDTNGDQQLSQGEEVALEAAGNPEPRKHAVSAETKLPSERALTQDETLIAELIATDWQPPETDARDNRATTIVKARRPEPGDLVADLRNAFRALDDAADPPPAVAEVLSVVAPPAADSPEAAKARALLLAVVESAKVGKLAKADAGVSVPVTFTLRGGAEPASAIFAMERAEGAWRGAAANTETLLTAEGAARQSIENTINAAAASVAQKSAAGELAAAWAVATPLADLLTAAGETPGSTKLAAALAAVPRLFESEPVQTALRGYTAVKDSADPKTGYPTQVTDSAGRTLLLMAIPPSDAGNWQLFYIDARESADQPDAPAGLPVDDIEAARKRATAVGRAVPTRAEWTAAALRLNAHPSSAGWLGGLWEWCEPEGDGPAWVCGGCSLSSELIPPPPAGAAPEALLTWLSDPLVTQQRRLGDGLVGVRTILRVYPE